MVDLYTYLKTGVENIVKGALKATAKDPRESAFMTRFSLSCRAAAVRRKRFEEQGEHIPAFLIVSITSSCNLHCEGCYSWQFHPGGVGAPVDQLTSEDWNKIFSEAKNLGISFILLAGGEPLMRRDVLEAAGKYPDILFPVFTNGTVFDEEYCKLFDAKRNLVPVISLEGAREKTDSRRGSGVYDIVKAVMEKIQKNHLIFGVSITMTTENRQEVTGEEFLNDLRSSGCKAVIYVEFVPVSERTERLALGDEERCSFNNRLTEIRREYPDMVFISFPGDEKSSGGCLAAGRGFFHINACGGAEPCPFSPYSDMNVKDHSLLDAMHSHLFTSLREGNILMENHSGGCVLFEKSEMVEKILGKGQNEAAELEG